MEIGLVGVPWGTPFFFFFSFFFFSYSKYFLQSTDCTSEPRLTVTTQDRSIARQDGDGPKEGVSECTSCLRTGEMSVGEG